MRVRPRHAETGEHIVDARIARRRGSFGHGERSG
jgi:hypothetical protein